MSQHTNEHGLWLEATLTGEALAASRRLELESCETCAARLHDLEAFQANLQALSTEDREILAHAERLDDAPGMAEVRALSAQIAARADSPRATSSARGTNLRLWVGMAAAIVVALLGWRFLAPSHTPEPRPDMPLGSVTLELVAPLGVVAQYSHFEWRGELPPGCWFELIVRDASAGVSVDARPLLDQRVLAASFDVSASMAASWPNHIDWEVRVSEPGPRSIKSAVGSAFRSP